ncbi:MAG: Lipopolysaccharide assembly protein B [Chlamydiae bacterium]|nr:Lipopolysaccharide assembly protein B [Chlamydiota bacterium]
MFLTILASLLLANSAATDYYTQGTALAEKEKVEQATESYRKALESDISSFSWSEQLEMVNYLYEHNQSDEAIDFLYSVLAADPDFIQARLTLALYLQHDQEYEKALSEIDKALEQTPDSRAALIIKANIFFATDEIDKAIDIYEEILSQDSIFAVELALSYAYMKKEEFEKAKNYLLQLQPENETEVEQINQYLELAETLKTQSIINKAYAFVEEKAYECAEVYLERELECQPCNYTIRLALSRIYGLDGLFQKGLRHLYSVLRQEPENRAARSQLAEIYRWKGDNVRSILLNRHLLQEKCTDDVELSLAYGYIAIGNRSGAKQIASSLKNKSLDEAIEKTPYVSGNYRILRDTQELRFQETRAKFGWWRGNCAFDLNYRHIDSSSVKFGGYLDQVSGNISLPINIFLDAGANIGVAHVNDRVIVTGGGKTMVRLPSGFLFASSQYAPYDGTAESLDVQIRQWQTLVQYTALLSERDSLGGIYTYNKYSDANHSNRINLFAQRRLRRKINSDCYSFPFNPIIMARYDVSYADTASIVAGGYFVGQDFVENRLTILFNILTKNNQPVLDIAPSGSYSSYSTGTTRLKGWFYGVCSTCNNEIIHNLFLTLAVKGGNYRYHGGVKYDYYELGARLRYVF